MKMITQDSIMTDHLETIDGDGTSADNQIIFPAVLYFIEGPQTISI